MIYIKTYNEPEIDIREIQRYAGCCGECETEIKACLSEISGKLSNKVCYTYLPVTDAAVNGWLNSSCALSKNLAACEQIVLFAATLGLELDRIIAKYSRISPSKALFFQAVGAERIEALCDMFNNEIKQCFSQKGLFTRPRFSPGYGDFSIDAQKEIFCILDCPRKIGVSLSDSLIMTPSKSVTAIIGISEKVGCISWGCQTCNKIDCEFRR